MLYITTLDSAIVSSMTTTIIHYCLFHCVISSWFFFWGYGLMAIPPNQKCSQHQSKDCLWYALPYQKLMCIRMRKDCWCEANVTGDNLKIACYKYITAWETCENKYLAYVSTFLCSCGFFLWLLPTKCLLCQTRIDLRSRTSVNYDTKSVSLCHSNIVYQTQPPLLP